MIIIIFFALWCIKIANNNTVIAFKKYKHTTNFLFGFIKFLNYLLKPTKNIVDIIKPIFPNT